MKYLITGGAGFIGTNFTTKLLERGDSVVVIDNLSRKGADLNLKFLQKQYDQKQHNKSVKFKFYQVDLCNADDLLAKLVEQVDMVFHLAGQVAVTNSVQNPQHDFSNNLSATFKLLEAIRASKKQPGLIYASTNKVYGNLTNLTLKETSSRYEFRELGRQGVNEQQNLDFHSPYGCSKGAAGQYVRDYARIYGLKTVVMRQSCIYGQHQFGVEDQGWVAWFVIAALLNKTITIYGNGKQVRDLLYVDDLFEAWDLASKNINNIAGEIYNIGGGRLNSLSLLEFVSLLEDQLDKKIDIIWDDWRPGDQKIYISDNKKIEKKLGWKITTNAKQGLRNLIKWVKNNEDEVNEVDSQADSA